MRLFRLATRWASVLMMVLALHAAPTPWDQPAAALSEQIAGILGPAQATLIVRNLSSIASSDVPAIRNVLEQDLKARGIALANGEGANTVRITLSQNDRKRLWVAEVVQGNQTRVVMVEADSRSPETTATADYMTLRRERLPISLNSISNAAADGPILRAFDGGNTLIVLRPEAVELFAFVESAWQHQTSVALNERRQLSRDPQGVLAAMPDGTSFTAFTSGNECSGMYAPGATTPAHPADGWAIHCHPSDDPWPILQSSDLSHPFTVKAFYNTARNSFTGVVTPSLGADLPPFYSAALLPRPSGVALLIGGIDGKMQLIESGALKPVSGARDWGSDFALLKSGCGSGTQVVASGSGEAAGDSLRAYEIPAQEAIPASAPLAMTGTVTSLWPSADGKSLLAAVRQASGDYEVDRVTALCN